MERLQDVTDLKNRSTTVGKSLTNTTGKSADGFKDATKSNPSRAAEGKSTVTAPVKTKINTHGYTVPETVEIGDEKEYGKAYTYTTPGGHVIEYNDTPGNERILLRHKSGTGINLGPDGSVIVSSTQRIDLIGEDHTLTAVNGELTYEGNLTLNVKGDYTVNVTGDYNVNSANYSNYIKDGGDYLVQVNNGEYSNIINGSKTEVISKNYSKQVLGTSDTIIKSDNKIVIGGTNILASKGKNTLTSEAEENAIVITAADINIAAQNISVFGAEGTIGGDNIIMYNKNMHTKKTVWSETIDTTSIHMGASGTISTDTIRARYISSDYFRGDLNGTASEAIKAGVAKSISSTITVGTIGLETPTQPTNKDTTATFKPDAALLKQYIENSGNGVFKINIDPNDTLLKNLDLKEKTGVSSSELTEEDIREQFRDPANKQNENLVAYGLSTNKISQDFVKPAPDKISYVQSTLDKMITGQTPIGNIDKYKVTKRIKIDDVST